MKKRILFIMPSYYKFDDVVRDGLTQFSGCEVTSIDPVGNQAYRHAFDRIKNFLSKVFLNKNLKPEMKRKYFSHIIDQHDSYDYLIVNRPDVIGSEVFAKAISKSKHKILLLWDSLEKVPIAHNLIQSFDRTYSFDQQDCEDYGFHKIENYHFLGDHPPISTDEFDAVFLGTLDQRIEPLKKVLDHLTLQDKTVRAYIYVPSRKHAISHPHIQQLHEITPFKDAYTFALKGKVVIDIGHENQRGLSFRVFEAMALGKKTITTNKYIKHYDFYNEDNIFVIEDIDRINIPVSFWATPYRELSPQMKAKYGIENWVKRILDER